MDDKFEVTALQKDKVIAGLFKSYNGFAISFHLCLEDDELKEKYEEIIEEYGGRYEKTLSDIHPRTVVIVDDNYSNHGFSRPVFELKYIKDCIQSKELLPLSDYLQNKACKYSGQDFLDVIYLRSNCFKDETNYYTQENKTEKSRQRFSKVEKVAIIKFIIGKNETKNLKGDRVWLKMERYNICPKRTHHCMKNHFLKSLVHELHKFDFLTPKQIQLIQQAAS